MKSKDMRELVLRLHQEGLNGTEIYHNLKGFVSRRTVFYKLINSTGTIDLVGTKGGSRIIRTKTLIWKVKETISKRKSSLRRLAKEMKIARGTIHRIIKEDLRYKAYRKRVASKMTDQHLIKRKSFGVWVRKM